MLVYAIFLNVQALSSYSTTVATRRDAGQENGGPKDNRSLFSVQGYIYSSSLRNHEAKAFYRIHSVRTLVLYFVNADTIKGLA
jgi:hypothetical protein